MDFWCGAKEIAPLFDGAGVMKKLVGILLFGLVSSAVSAPVIQAFVSFSMPEQLLRQTLTESARIHIPTYLNGLYHNSMKETAQKILGLTKLVPNLNLQIDPTAFERFGIYKVPALVVSNTSGFDVIYGNHSLCEDLDRIASNGKTHTADSGLAHEDVRGICGA